MKHLGRDSESRNRKSIQKIIKINIKSELYTLCYKYSIKDINLNVWNLFLKVFVWNVALCGHKILIVILMCSTGADENHLYQGAFEM